MKKILITLILVTIGLINISAQAPPVATATSKMAWDIPAQDLNSAQGYAYKWYLDGSATGNQFSGVLCSGVSPTFNCQVVFPALTQGNHTMRISATNAAGEGPLSDPFAFSFVGNPGKPVNLHIVSGS
jgi:hypothetical protein